MNEDKRTDPRVELLGNDIEVARLSLEEISNIAERSPKAIRMIKRSGVLDDIEVMVDDLQEMTDSVEAIEDDEEPFIVVEE